MKVRLCSLGILLSLLVDSDGQVRPNWDMPRFGGRDWGQNGFNFDLGQNDRDRGRNPFGSFRPNQAPTQQPPIVGQIPGQIGQRGLPGAENQPPPLPPMPQEPGSGQGELPAPSQPPPEQGVSQVPTPLEPQPSPGDGMGPGLLGGFGPSEFPPLFLSSTSPSPELGARGFGGSSGGGFPSLAGPNEIEQRGGGMPGMLGSPRGFGEGFLRPGFDRPDSGQGVSPVQPPMEQSGQDNTSVPSMSQRGSMGDSSSEQPPFLEDSQEVGKAKVPAEPLKQLRGHGQGDIFELSKSHLPGRKDGRGFRGKDIHPKVPKLPVSGHKSPEVLEDGMSPKRSGVEPIKQVVKPGQSEVSMSSPSFPENYKGGGPRGRNLPPSKILVIPNTPDIKDAEIVPTNLGGNRGQRTPPPQIDVRQGGRGKGEEGGLEGTGQSGGVPDYTPRPSRGK